MQDKNSEFFVNSNVGQYVLSNGFFFASMMVIGFGTLIENLGYILQDSGHAAQIKYDWAM